MHRYDAILAAFNNSIWPILPEKMDALVALLEVKAAGLAIDAATVERVAAQNRSASRAQVTRSVAVLPVCGVICQRMDLMSEFSGGCSTERLGKDLDALLKDDEVGCIVLDVDSPGGNYCGTPELAEKIFQARGQKPIVAVANSMAASAAYWIASACDELVVTPSGEVGSIGVLAVHYDRSAANEEEGVKPTYVTYGKYKAEFNPDNPLSDEALKELQSRVDDAGETFIKAVAKQRGCSQTKVREEFGQGRMCLAAEAVRRGMADRVDTLEATVARLSGARKAKTGKAKAAAERQRLALERFR
jgi:signal peptide peptidase SppA